MKRTLALLLSLTMLMSLLIVPANAADEDVVLKITPDKTNINTATAQDVTYTVSVEVKDSSVKIGGIQFTLDAPSGMTIPTKLNADNFQINSSELKLVKDEYDNVTGGIFDTFGYTKETYIFIASGTTEDRNLNKNAEIMKIKVSVAENTTGSLNFTAKNVEFAKVDGGAVKWTYRIDTTAVEASSATSNELPVTIAKPATGGTPQGDITETADYTGSITWTPAVAGGKFAANTEYTANVKLTAKGEYKFASDVTPTVTDATISDKNVTDEGKTLTFKAKFSATGNKTLKGIDIITKPELKLAVPTAAPNATATNERSLAVTGVYDDGSGGPVAVNWEFMATPGPKGVYLDGSTLKVTNEAQAGTFMIKATSIEGGHTDSETVTITKEGSKETHIVATHPATGTNITIPNVGTKTSGSCSYKFYDQYGAEMPGIGATWKMKLEPTTVTGVTLTTDGAIAVTNDATTCTATVYAEGSGVKSNEITFNIIREESKPSVVTITGADSVNVPIVHAPGADGWEHKTYTAEVKDQYNNVISNPSVEWSVTEATGVSIDTTGKLTVSNKANAGTVTITAKSGDATKTKDVTINKELAKATLVEICNQVGDGPETNLHIPAATFTNSEAYTAKVYDQYGVHMPGEMVDWALDPATVNGVELDTTASTGNAILKVDSTAAPGTTFKLKATTATPDTTGVKELDITLTNKTPASVTTAPKAVENLKYTGDKQALVTAGAASGGTMQYSLDNGATWSPDVPTGKNAGTYTVQYKVVGDETHSDTTPVTLPVIIGQKEVTVAAGDYKVSKKYDSTTTAGTGNGVLSVTGIVDSGVSVKATPVAYTDANVGGQSTMNVTITLDGTGNSNYKIKNGATTISVPCEITAKEVTLTGGINATDRSYVKDNKTVDLTKGTLLFTGLEGSETLDVNIPATGTISDAAAGNGKTVAYSGVTLKDGTGKASNYTLNATLPTVTVNITKATAPTLSDIAVSQKYTVTAEQSKDIGRAGMPTDAGTLTYSVGTATKTGSASVTSSMTGSTVKFTITGGANGEVITLPVTITSDNYADSIVNVKITLTKPSYSGGGGGGSSTPSYTVSVDKTENGTITVSPKSASKGDTVTITVKPDKGYELEMLKALDKDGDALKLTEKNGKYTFKMPSGKVTVKGSFVEEAPVQIFKDVPVDAYYYEAVKWAAEKGITGGVGNGLFAPNQPCTRAQIVTFLWRAAGSPAPKNMSSFTDVPADAFYAKAVAWAVENGITGGTGDGKFSPDATCTRAQSVTFLYRAAGSPKVSGSAEFGDVATNAYYADAVAWAAKNGITGGIGGGLFGSGNDCTRAQIVTFLYRSVK